MKKHIQMKLEDIDMNPVAPSPSNICQQTHIPRLTNRKFIFRQVKVQFPTICTLHGILPERLTQDDPPRTMEWGFGKRTGGVELFAPNHHLFVGQNELPFLHRAHFAVQGDRYPVQLDWIQRQRVVFTAKTYTYLLLSNAEMVYAKCERRYENGMNGMARCGWRGGWAILYGCLGNISG